MFRLKYNTAKYEFSFECGACSSPIKYKYGAVVPLYCPICKGLVTPRPDQLYESTYYRRGHYKSVKGV